MPSYEREEPLRGRDLRRRTENIRAPLEYNRPRFHPGFKVDKTVSARELLARIRDHSIVRPTIVDELEKTIESKSPRRKAIITNIIAKLEIVSDINRVFRQLPGGHFCHGKFRGVRYRIFSTFCTKCRFARCKHPNRLPTKVDLKIYPQKMVSTSAKSEELSLDFLQKTLDRLDVSPGEARLCFDNIVFTNSVNCMINKKKLKRIAGIPANLHTYITMVRFYGLSRGSNIRDIRRIKEAEVGITVIMDPLDCFVHLHNSRHQKISCNIFCPGKYVFSGLCSQDQVEIYDHLIRCFLEPYLYIPKRHMVVNPTTGAVGYTFTYEDDEMDATDDEEDTRNAADNPGENDEDDDVASGSDDGNDEDDDDDDDNGTNYGSDPDLYESE